MILARGAARVALTRGLAAAARAPGARAPPPAAAAAMRAARGAPARSAAVALAAARRAGGGAATRRAGARTFASDGGLGEAIAAELEEEEGNGAGLNDGPPPPNDFVVEPTPGMRNVIAKRSVDGDDVTVTLDVFGETDDVGELPPELGGPAPGDDEDEPARFFTAMVKVERAGGKAMSFQVELEQDSFEVLSAQTPPMDLDAINDQRYLSPEYENLADSVQDAVVAFLAERGMDEEFFGWLFNAAIDKEEAEYVEWLRRVKDFLE